MPRPMFDSPFIFGLHDPGGEPLMAQAGRKGWIVFTVEVGANPNDTSGFDFSPWANQEFGIICRINNGYGSAGTIPYSAAYADFAKRVGNFVAASRGCKIWLIGNEMNHSQEWPAAPGSQSALAPASAPVQPRFGPNEDPFGRSSPSRFSALHTADKTAIAPAAATEAGRQPITPTLYAQCFRQCRDAIKLQPGHGDDQVCIGAVAPWNNQTTYASNPNGSWIQYFSDVLALLGAGGLDGIALHTYTHGSDPALVTDRTAMNPPFQNCYYNFQAYRNFMEAIPAAMRSLPVYITETDQDSPWLDQNNGWVQAAYAEINSWNQQANAQQIRALALYRWPKLDQWYIEGKQGVIAGFNDAMQNDYRWKAPLPKPADFQAGDQVRTTDYVNFRQSPGGAPLATLPPNTQLVVASSQYVSQNGLIWWNLRLPQPGGVQSGWIAQYTADGVVLLEEIAGAPPAVSFQAGDQVRTTTVVRMRQTPGVTGKPAADIVADVPGGTVLTVIGGPQAADGMTWWRTQGKLADGRQVSGWQAEALTDGSRLLEKVSAAGAGPVASGIDQPATGVRVGDRIRTTTAVRLRKSAGSANKPADDTIAVLNAGEQGAVLSGPTMQDGMTWWSVAIDRSGGQSLQGWVAEVLSDGTRLIERVTGPAPLAAGDFARIGDFANVRRTPGIANKPAGDVAGMLPPGTIVNLLAGPQALDGLTWWKVSGIAPNGDALLGYVAQKAPDGTTLLAAPPTLPNTNIPDKVSGAYLGAPFQGAYGIAQLFGENPDFYKQFNYDGAALRGHNGIDFLTPNGTVIFAVDNGTVSKAGFEDGGFGNFVLIAHAWGESLYAHLESSSVSPGQVVGRGQVIAISDNTGGSQGPHLHFGIRINPYQRTDGWGGFSDPLPYLQPGAFSLPAYAVDPANLVIAPSLAAPADQLTNAKPSSMGNVPGNQRP